jgi:hypothetical protein
VGILQKEAHTEPPDAIEATLLLFAGMVSTYAWGILSGRQVARTQLRNSDPQQRQALATSASASPTVRHNETGAGND